MLPSPQCPTAPPDDLLSLVLCTLTIVDDMKEAVALLTCRVVKKLRRETLTASVVTVFGEASGFAPENERYANGVTRSPQTGVHPCYASRLRPLTSRRQK